MLAARLGHKANPTSAPSLPHVPSPSPATLSWDPHPAAGAASPWQLTQAALVVPKNPTTGKGGTGGAQNESKAPACNQTTGYNLHSSRISSPSATSAGGFYRKNTNHPHPPSKILSCLLKHLLARDVQPRVCHRFLTHTRSPYQFLCMSCIELKCTIGWEHPRANRPEMQNYSHRKALALRQARASQGGRNVSSAVVQHVTPSAVVSK